MMESLLAWMGSDQEEIKYIRQNMDFNQEEIKIQNYFLSSRMGDNQTKTGHSRRNELRPRMDNIQDGCLPRSNEGQFRKDGGKGSVAEESLLS
jgi:hypothetical protein